MHLHLHLHLATATNAAKLRDACPRFFGTPTPSRHIMIKSAKAWSQAARLSNGGSGEDQHSTLHLQIPPLEVGRVAAERLCQSARKSTTRRRTEQRGRFLQ